MLDPVRGTSHHLAEQKPIGIAAPIPIEQVVRFVPELDVAEMVAVARQYVINEIGVVLQPMRCAG